jgi:DNA-binding response OmpR family regulator
MTAKILIVDDDPDMVELLRLSLTEAGYLACTATTGTEALAEVQRSSPDLVVLDLLLPEMNGFSVCEHLRQNPATATIPIIMITVLPGQFPRLVGVESGVNAYVNKPFQTQELVSCVDDLLRVPDLLSTTVNARPSVAASRAGCRKHQRGVNAAPAFVLPELALARRREAGRPIQRSQFSPG